MERYFAVLILGVSGVMIACGGASNNPGTVGTTTTVVPTSNSSGTTTQTVGCDNPIKWGAYLPSATSSGGMGFAATGSMIEARAGHTATLLPDGTVLVVAGGLLDIDDLLVSIPSAETFDPSQGKFESTARPCVARELHTATLLPNGKVLVAGGSRFTGYPTWLDSTSSAELYDPASRTFAATGSMTAGRTLHTATLLKDGRVLIVGGSTTDGSGTSTTRSGLASAETYDSSSQNFSITGGMASARLGHTATLLQSGKVLIAGGENEEGALATAELFDPSTNTFTPAGTMTVPRTGHAAVLLADGKVLVMGGSQSNAFRPGIMGPNSPPQSTAEVYDPATGGFSPVGTMDTGRIGHTATLLPNGDVLVTGGYLDYSMQTIQGNLVGYKSLSSAEIFHPGSSTFTSTGPMTTTRFWHTATRLLDGSVLIAGGIGQDSPKSSAEIYK